MIEDQAAAQVAAKLLGYLETTRSTPGWGEMFHQLVVGCSSNDGTIIAEHTNVKGVIFLRARTPWWDRVPELTGFDKVVVCSDGRVLALGAYDPIMPLL